MDARSGWSHRHALLVYLLLAFGISWAGVIAIAGTDGFPVASDAEFRRLIAPMVVVMLLGPSVASLVATWLDGGRDAMTKLFARVRLWRVAPRWYAIALLTAPTVIISALVILSMQDPWYRSGLVTAERPLMHLLLGVLTGVAAGVFEEIGWTGFATPALRKRFTPITTGLVLGVIWGLWHLVATYWGSNSAGDVPRALYVPVLLFASLVPYRVLMTWVHERTGSVFVAMVMHGALTGSLRILEPIGIGGWRLMTWAGMTGILFCLLAVSIVPWRRAEPLASALQ